MMSQVKRIKEAIQQGYNTIQGIMDFTCDIPRPSIRRVPRKVSSNVSTGVYTLTTDTGEERLYMECGKAEEVLPRLAAEGRKFDMAFLDPAYYSYQLIGRNRLKSKDWYDFMMPDAFGKMASAVCDMLRTEDSHVYLMLSGARTAQKDMQKYLDAAIEAGLTYIQEGTYSKTYASGKPIVNINGKDAPAERVILMSKSGKLRTGEVADVLLDFIGERPPVKTSYRTQKNEAMLDRLIMQSTLPNETVCDPCAGSGKTGERSLFLNRISIMVECRQSAIDDFIIPKIQTLTL